ncbi:hypothetical protein M427DRAFT_27528 [Gonapodya prolifera JEL478]|uniref:Hemerythrin-like domain-containing protein n=1 Tax=Gonapodya prolifera (strain JEL478) TaxID=1344416 RepID=A0A139AWW3_GONPJ|nr:hypothetical protein M427DRAFT_27528 [Gonapodya prolifera JEL478]|eukprot:KXS21073.1 hypothetical protein M427DRAFT_27528 [Gonapodya prolifera JEL478]
MQAAATPLPSALQAAGSIGNRIMSDHKAIFDLYDRYQAATDPNLREKIENTIIREIAVHSTVEEIVVYPVIEKNFENGKAHADKLRAEHLQVKKDFQNFDTNREPTLLSKIIRELRRHVDFEDQQEIPQLKAKLTTAEDQSLVTQWDKTRPTVPTRPHPLAPDHGGITEAAAGMLAKPLDAIKNATREFVEVVREE